MPVISEVRFCTFKTFQLDILIKFEEKLDFEFLPDFLIYQHIKQQQLLMSGQTLSVVSQRG